MQDDSDEITTNLTQRVEDEMRLSFSKLSMLTVKTNGTFSHAMCLSNNSSRV